MIISEKAIQQLVEQTILDQFGLDVEVNILGRVTHQGSQYFDITYEHNYHQTKMTIKVDVDVKG